MNEQEVEELETNLAATVPPSRQTHVRDNPGIVLVTTFVSVAYHKADRIQGYSQRSCGLPSILGHSTFLYRIRHLRTQPFNHTRKSEPN
jgi:hypothetical protein